MMAPLSNRPLASQTCNKDENHGETKETKSKADPDTVDQSPLSNYHHAVHVISTQEAASSLESPKIGAGSHSTAPEILYKSDHDDSESSRDESDSTPKPVASSIVKASHDLPKPSKVDAAQNRSYIERKSLSDSRSEFDSDLEETENTIGDSETEDILGKLYRGDKIIPMSPFIRIEDESTNFEPLQLESPLLGDFSEFDLDSNRTLNRCDAPPQMPSMGQLVSPLQSDSESDSTDDDRRCSRPGDISLQMISMRRLVSPPQSDSESDSTDDDRRQSRRGDFPPQMPSMRQFVSPTHSDSESDSTDDDRRQSRRGDFPPQMLSKWQLVSPLQSESESDFTDDDRRQSRRGDFPPQMPSIRQFVSTPQSDSDSQSDGTDDDNVDENRGSSRTIKGDVPPVPVRRMPSEEGGNKWNLEHRDSRRTLFRR